MFSFFLSLSSSFSGVVLCVQLEVSGDGARRCRLSPSMIKGEGRLTRTKNVDQMLDKKMVEHTAPGGKKPESAWVV